MKIAVIYDWIDSEGGIERAFPILFKYFKNADIYTSYTDLTKAKWAKNLKIKTSFIQNLPNFIKKNRLISFVFYPYAFESFNLNKYDLVFSVSSSFAKSVITKPETIHINYMLTPTRYFWIDKESYFKNPFVKFFGRLFLKKYKKWDYVVAQRPDRIITISEYVRKKIKKYYNRNSIVIYPPFDIDYWSKIKKSLNNINQDHKKYYLLVSRFEPYKKTEIAIQAFNRLNKRLIIVGSGTQEYRLKKIANRNIEFRKNITDKKLADLYLNAKALIMPQSEEFGMVALEAQFFGCPVISFINSGVCEIIIKDKTAIYFKKQTADDLIKAVVRYESISYNLKRSTEALKTNYFQKFDKKIFLNKIQTYISNVINTNTQKI
jgi:glycosyltransferase involved in cell wall biosynthesis